MSEYLVKYKVSVPGFLFTHSFKGSMVCNGDSAQAAIDGCKSKIEFELMGEIDLGEVNFSVIDVKKL